MNCRDCSKQYFCDLTTPWSENNKICEKYKSWIYTKNYGEVHKIENSTENKKKKFNILFD